MSDCKSARNFHNYQVWQDAVAFATKVYEVTSKMPWFEKKGLCDQLQRAAVSIPSNIAEGSGHPSDLDFAHYLDMSIGSANEVETQLIISKNVGYLKTEIYTALISDVDSIRKQLIGLVSVLRQAKPTQRK